MFTGIDEVDWASMEHAYGPADDVPAMLRGLASDDPAERETALDGMYGAVHHQGDVYACTLACIPFLFELVVDPGIQDRGSIVELLTSIGGIDLDEDDEDEIDEEEIEGAANYAMAATAVTACAGVFCELMADEDPGCGSPLPWRSPPSTTARHGCSRCCGSGCRWSRPRRCGSPGRGRRAGRSAASRAGRTDGRLAVPARR